MHDVEHTSPTPDLASRPLGVLVGYDGSDQAIKALVYAARAARRADCPLTVATAFTVPASAQPNLGSLAAATSETQQREAIAKALLQEALGHLEDFDGQVLTRLEVGDAAGAMVRLSSQARLAVVGARGRGGFVGRLLGSVSSALPAHAHCPTVVVPRDYDIGEGEARFAPVESEAPVVVGVDRSERSEIALQIAALAAAARQTTLHMLVVMPPPENWGGWYASLIPGTDVIEQERKELEKEVAADAAAVSAQHDGLPVTSEVLVSDAASELIARSGRAQLTVVGTRGHGRMASALLGSVSRTLLMHAEGPVLVVPDLDPVRNAVNPSHPR